MHGFQHLAKVMVAGSNPVGRSIHPRDGDTTNPFAVTKTRSRSCVSGARSGPRNRCAVCSPWPSRGRALLPATPELNPDCFHRYNR